jgi:hypothetical protein
MLKWRLKACPKCHGDTFIDRDTDGWYEQCLQCSHRREMRDIADFNKDRVGVRVGESRISFKDEDWSKSEDES